MVPVGAERSAAKGGSRAAKGKRKGGVEEQIEHLYQGTPFGRKLRTGHASHHDNVSTTPVSARVQNTLAGSVHAIPGEETGARSASRYSSTALRRGWSHTQASIHEKPQLTLLQNNYGVLVVWPADNSILRDIA